jgi:hypothetical protein
MTHLIAILISTALANEVVTAKAVPNVTREQVQASSTLINVATFNHNSQRYGVRCAGSGNELRCEVVQKSTNEVVIRSGNLQVCKRNNNVAIMSEANGLEGKVIVLPGIINAAGRAACRG